MTITYPRELPAWLRVLTPTRLALLRDESRNTRRGGAVQIVERSHPRWQLELVTGHLTADRVAEAEAFVGSLRGGLNDFLYRDPRHVTPRSYGGSFAGLDRHGGGAFDGTADVDAVTAASVTLSNLPSTFALKAGDRVGLAEDGALAVHVVLEDATAVAGTVTLAVDPFILTGIFSTSATAQFLRPPMRMMLTGFEPPNGSALQSLKLSAIQRIV
jgi:hypothetical protein